MTSGTKLLLRTTILAGSMMTAFAAPAVFAQETTPQDSAASEDESKSGEVSLRSDIVVTGRRGRMVNSGGLGARSILDTPFSVTSVTSEEIADKVAVTVEEILKGDSGVRTAGNGTASILPEVTVRGLLLDQLNSYKVDGMTYPNRSSLPAEHYQQVELLKGLSGFMYGFGTPGGIVNYISKRPLPERALTLGVNFNSDATFRGMADTNLRFGKGDSIGLRVVGVHEQGNTYVDDDGYINRDSVSASLAADLNDTVTLLADGLYQDRHAEGVIFSVLIPAANAAIPMMAPVDGRTNLAESGSYFHTETILGTVGADFNFSSDWKANISYRFAEANADWREGNANILNAAGDYSFTEFVSRQTHRYNQAQALVLGTFNTGALEHQVTFGASWQKLEQFNDRTPFTFNLPGPSNLYNVVQIPGSMVSGKANPLFLTLEIVQKALFVSDTITWGDFSLLAGARLNQFDQTNLNAAGAVTASYKTTPLTPTLALRYKPGRDTTLYVSYVQALEKGGQASVLNANFGDIFGPLKSKQYEIGVKTDRSGWAASASAFRILRGAEYTTTANIYVQDGQSRFQGIESSLTLRPLDGFSVTVQGMYLDAKLIRGAVNVGKRIPGAAKWQGSIQAEYSPPAFDELKFLTSLTYLGDSKLEATNLREVPGFATWDASVRYRLGEVNPITINFGVRNITDKKYWTIRNSGTPSLQQGAPRTVALGASVSF